MRWGEIDQQVCSVSRALSVVGDRWTLLILRDIFFGARRFDELQRQSGISRHRLSDRLGKLVDEEVLVRVRYQQRPDRFEYRLTRKGADLYPVMLALTRWGDAWADDGHGRPVEYVHRDCGKATRPELCCSECQQPLTPGNVAARIGPGLAAALSDGRGMYPAPAPSLPPLLRDAGDG
jgi:DNA-binding HxlR family transcriptional regulator